MFVEDVEGPKTSIQFYLVLFFYLFSSYIKYFREEVCNNFMDDEVLAKMQELNSKLHPENKHE